MRALQRNALKKCRVSMYIYRRIHEKKNSMTNAHMHSFEKKNKYNELIHLTKHYTDTRRIFAHMHGKQMSAVDVTCRQYQNQLFPELNKNY